MIREDQDRRDPDTRGDTAAVTHQDGGRFASLDGLRGLAALTVTVHHALLTDDSERLAWTGAAAVFVFFVLSGFVLSLPFLRETPTLWRSYYPARLVRLYVPVWGAVALSTILIIAVPRDHPAGQAPWVADHDVSLNMGTVLGDLTLISPTWNTNPLWSLQFEVAFSLLLPLYLVGASRVRSLLGAAASGCAALVVCGIGAAWGNTWLTYMPMFAVGVLMSVQRFRLLTLARRTPTWAWVILCVTAVLLLRSSWLLFEGIGNTSGVVLGAALAVFIFLGWPVAVRLTEARGVQLLGALSFSLYLVHDPIIVTVAYLWPTAQSPWVLVVALPVSLAAAWVFHRWVESPAHRLSKATGRAAARIRRPGPRRIA